MKKVPTLEEFDKTLTQQIDDEGYLNWPDETLGRCVRSFAKKLFETDMTGFKGIKTMAAVYVLIEAAMSVNATELKQKVEGFTNRRYPERGSSTWRIVVEEISSTPNPEGDSSKEAGKQKEEIEKL